MSLTASRDRFIVNLENARRRFDMSRSFTVVHAPFILYLYGRLEALLPEQLQQEIDCELLFVNVEQAMVDPVRGSGRANNPFYVTPRGPSQNACLLTRVRNIRTPRVSRETDVRRSDVLHQTVKLILDELTRHLRRLRNVYPSTAGTEISSALAALHRRTQDFTVYDSRAARPHSLRNAFTTNTLVGISQHSVLRISTLLPVITLDGCPVSYAERWGVEGAEDRSDLDRRALDAATTPSQQEIVFPESPRMSPRGVILEDQPALATILSRSSHPAAELLASYLSEEEHTTLLHAVLAHPKNTTIRSLCQKIFPTIEVEHA